MKQNKNQRALESYKVFPYIAWSLVIVFAFFVYDITMKLVDVTDKLEQQTIRLETQAKTAPDQIEDFSR